MGFCVKLSPNFPHEHHQRKLYQMKQEDFNTAFKRIVSCDREERHFLAMAVRKIREGRFKKYKEAGTQSFVSIPFLFKHSERGQREQWQQSCGSCGCFEDEFPKVEGYDLSLLLRHDYKPSTELLVTLRMQLCFIFSCY